MHVECSVSRVCMCVWWWCVVGLIYLGMHVSVLGGLVCLDMHACVCMCVCVGGSKHACV